MRCNMHVALVALGLLLGTGGCTSYLTGDKLSSDPNFPSNVSAEQLFVAIQAGQFAFQEGTVAMMMCEWVQSCGAANGRFVQQAGQYVFGETSNIGANAGDWITGYDGGGFVDIRNLEALLRSSGDRTWLGIAKIWEAFTIGTISDMWGDVPYSQVTASKTPVLDNRFAILASVQTLLDGAIADLQSGAGSGPGIGDLVLGGNAAPWIKIAYTLKARYYLHTAESLGTPAYQAAITNALQGISDASGKSDFASFHTAAQNERNMWAQFQTSSGFGTDLTAGKFLADYMNARSDPRRSKYFCYNGTAGQFGGDDFNTPQPPAAISPFRKPGCIGGAADRPARFADEARMPYVSYVENELILAEAYAQTGDEPSARTHLNNAYATVAGLASTAGTATGAALMDSIMMEKYVALFQNIESMTDYRRTCIPAVTVVANNQGFSHVPGRLFYPQNERNVNTNIPDASTQLSTHGFRNAGDVHACGGGDNAP